LIDASHAVGPSWLRDHAWPLWLERGVDWKRRAFYEHLDHALQCRADFRRLRVAARQTYVFSKAASHGVAGASDAVALGLDFLRGPARLKDGGYASRFDLHNRPTDTTRDLYDHAFVLLAFATAAAVFGPDRLRDDALAVLDYVTANFPHPAGGYQESIPPVLPRRQNPHMHFFEALLAAHDAFGDGIFLDRATELANLCLTRLFQPQEGALPEFFDSMLVPERENGLFAVEPGHHYEWVWLLHWYATREPRASSMPLFVSACADLHNFADRYGVNAACGLVINMAWSNGTVRDGGIRLWPQTERLKAQARRRDTAGVAAARAGLAKHFFGVHPGLWAERMDVCGRALDEPAPASSLYHLTAALTDEAVIAFPV
jgi:mannose/cellobiose epimerase-like protein (N-acyl-D-glucosamine 2-epimerase family)